MIIELISGFLLVAGAVFMLIASIGIIRFPDLLMRMHAATKAGSLGAGMILIGAALTFSTMAIYTRVITTVLFILLTAPVAAHVIGRVGYHVGIELWEGTIIDELKEDLKKNKVHDKENDL